MSYDKSKYHIIWFTFSLVQFSHSVVSDSAIPWTAACKASLSFSVSQWLLKLMFIESVMPSNRLILCCPLLLPSPLFNLSQQQGLFKWVSSSHQVAKILELQLQHQSFQWIFRTDSFRLTGSPCSPRDLRSLLHHHSSQTSILRLSAFFIVQLSQPYMTTGKNHSFDQTDLCWQSNVSAF